MAIDELIRQLAGARRRVVVELEPGTDKPPAAPDTDKPPEVPGTSAKMSAFIRRRAGR